jgi:hypothetical protein
VTRRATSFKDVTSRDVFECRSRCPIPMNL